MASYHITDDGPRACSTTPDRCPYGRQGGEHFDNVAEAQLDYERTMEASYGVAGLASAARGSQTELYRIYSKLDRVERDSETYKRVASVAAYNRSAPSKNPRSVYVPSGRSKGYDRMRRNHSSRSISKLAVRGGNPLLQSVGSTPQNILNIRSLLTKGPQIASK